VLVDIDIGYRAHGRVSGNDSLERSETATDTLHRREPGRLAHLCRNNRELPRHRLRPLRTTSSPESPIDNVRTIAEVTHTRVPVLLMRTSARTRSRWDGRCRIS
jgi:hypothetical protein